MKILSYLSNNTSWTVWHLDTNVTLGPEYCAYIKSNQRSLTSFEPSI